MNNDLYIINKLKAHMDDWVWDALAVNNCYIAGGAITSIASNTQINDIDIYFSSKEALFNVIEGFNDDDTWCAFVSEKSLTYVTSKATYQLIYLDYYDKSEDIFNHFDYSINMAACSPSNEVMTYHDNFWMHMSQRYLQFNENTLFPIISLLRLYKYSERGYTYSKSTVVKIAMTISKLNITTWKEFKNAVGNLYKCNHITNERIKNLDYSFDEAMKILEEVSFSELSDCVIEYEYDPRLVGYIVSQKEVEVYKDNKGNWRLLNEIDHINPDCLYFVINNGILNLKEVDAPIKETPSRLSEDSKCCFIKFMK
jgi:hypothetical protein